jgi:hypothetical protein
VYAQIPPQDSRNIETPDTNTHFRMPVFRTREAWLAKAAFLRKQILSSVGLLPMPEKAPVHAEIFGRLDRRDYPVEKVLLETYPGFYLGGNLYRPLGKSGPFPAVVSPHGHWAYGRLENSALVSVPARCINLARQGFVVFSYHMVPYNDTNQFPHGDNGPGLGGRPEDLWSIHTMGLQLWNSIRGVDFVSGLPDVDRTRIAATSASGGGTQTFLLMAVDDRIPAAAPVNMVSAIMQGDGCEEAANLRIGAFNVMFAAMMAPRPLLLVSATGDWTRNTPREEFPAVQSIYKLMDARARSRSSASVSRCLRSSWSSMGEAARRMRCRHQYVADRIAEARMGIEVLAPRDRASLARAREEFEDRLSYPTLVIMPSAAETLAEKKGVHPGRRSTGAGPRREGKPHSCRVARWQFVEPGNRAHDCSSPGRLSLGINLRPVSRRTGQGHSGSRRAPSWRSTHFRPGRRRRHASEASGRSRSSTRPTTRIGSRIS